MNPSNRNPRRTSPAVDARRAELLKPFGSAPFTTAAALAAGMTQGDLRSHAVTPVFRGVYVAGQQRILDHGARCAAAVTLIGSDAWVASLDAARLHGLPVETHDRPRVSLPRSSRGRQLSDVHLVRRHPDTPGATVWVKSVATQLPVTHPWWVLPECLDVLTFVDATVLADAVLARSPDEEAVRSIWCGLPIASRRRLERIAMMARGASESPMETRLRLLLVLAGFPEPVLQHRVVVEGHHIRFDLAYPQAGIGIEYDGAHHFASEAQRHADIRRTEALTRAGWHRIPVVSRGILRDPLGTLDEVASICRARGITVNRSDEWARHFTQRDSRHGYGS